MHHFAYLATLDNQSSLHTLAHTDQMMMHGRDGQQRWDEELLVEGSFLGRRFNLVGENDVVEAFIDSLFRIFAETVESRA